MLFINYLLFIGYSGNERSEKEKPVSKMQYNEIKVTQSMESPQFLVEEVLLTGFVARG